APGGARLAALGDTCAPGPSIPAIAHLGPLPPVAAPPANEPALPDPLAGPVRSACDVPGSGCTRRTRVVEHPPATAPSPGGRGRGTAGADGGGMGSHP